MFLYPIILIFSIFQYRKFTQYIVLLFKSAINKFWLQPTPTNSKKEKCFIEVKEESQLFYLDGKKILNIFLIIMYFATNFKTERFSHIMPKLYEVSQSVLPHILIYSYNGLITLPKAKVIVNILSY